jgi:hypothetical protein
MLADDWYAGEATPGDPHVEVPSEDIDVHQARAALAGAGDPALSELVTVTSTDGSVVAVADLCGRLHSLTVTAAGRPATHVLQSQLVDAVNSVLDRSAEAAKAAAMSVVSVRGNQNGEAP